MPVEIELHGLEETIEKMKESPRALRRLMKLGMENSLLALWENVPPYPRKPADSTYDRKGILGKTLGVDMNGGKISTKPDIYRVIDRSERFEGRFGTKLKYAPYVIGDVEQARVHRERWWTMSKIAENAKDKITQIWDRLVEEIAKRFD